MTDKSKLSQSVEAPKKCPTCGSDQWNIRKTVMRTDIPGRGPMTFVCPDPWHKAASQPAPAATTDLRLIIERDRSMVAEGVTNIEKAISERSWIAEGRGSYEYDDDRYRQEFSWAIADIRKALEPLKKLAADMEYSPRRHEEVEAARAIPVEADGPLFRAVSPAPPARNESHIDEWSKWVEEIDDCHCGHQSCKEEDKCGTCYAVKSLRKLVGQAQLCGHPEDTDEHAGISHIPFTKAHTFVPIVQERSKCDGCGYPVKLPNELCDECREDYLAGNLLPCPFCNGQASMKDADDGASFIECDRCGASTNLQYSLKDDGRPQLYQRWNTRVS